MKEAIKISWLNNLAFEAEVDGHKLLMDRSPEKGGKTTGPRPKPLMMVALGGCTGMDVASILKKMRVDFDELSIEVKGDVAEKQPKEFTGMKIIYRVKGRGIKREKVEKAVNLSFKKHCCVSVNYSKSFPITHEIIIEE